MSWWRRFMGRACTTCQGEGAVTPSDIIERIDKTTCDDCLGTGLRFVQVAELKRRLRP